MRMAVGSLTRISYAAIGAEGAAAGAAKRRQSELAWPASGSTILGRISNQRIENVKLIV